MRVDRRAGRGRPYGRPQMQPGSGRGLLGGGRLGAVGAARLGAVLEVDVVDLERDALFARARLVRARLEAAGEGQRLALDEVLGGGLRLAFPEDELDVDGLGAAVAAVA